MTTRSTEADTLVDSGLLIAAVNRGDQHHLWAVRQLAAARRGGRPLLVPELVIGETYTKLRYDRRVSAHRDARVALTVFQLIDENPDLFSVTPAPPDAYSRARALLSRYSDQAFSYVDAVIFLTADDSPSIDAVLTVDDRDFRVYRFSHELEVLTPRS